MPIHSYIHFPSVDTKEPDSMNVTVMFKYSMHCSAVITEEKGFIVTAGHCGEPGMTGKKRICKKPEVIRVIII